MYALYKPVIAVVGSRNSGKTMAVEVLVHGLSSRGYRVATVKHIPKPNFTIDSEGTDTWRHAKAGASIVIGVSPNELAVIKRVDTRGLDLDNIMTECGEDIDVVILEGFKKIVRRVPYVLKIVAVKNHDEIQEASKAFSPILAYTGLVSAKEVPQPFDYVNLLEEKEKLVNLVYEKVEDVRSRSKPLKETRILIDGKSLPCKRFVREIVRKTVLAMISALKATDIRGDEEVHIMIKSKAK